MDKYDHHICIYMYIFIQRERERERERKRNPYMHNIQACTHEWGVLRAQLHDVDRVLRHTTAVATCNNHGNNLVDNLSSIYVYYSGHDDSKVVVAQAM